MLGLVLAAARAHALDPAAPGLNWVRLPGAESCIAAQALAARIEERVGRVLFVTIAEAGLSVDGSVRRGTPDGWDMPAPDTVRLHGASCDKAKLSAEHLGIQFPCGTLKPR